MRLEMSSESSRARHQIDILSIAEGYFHSSVIFALLKLNIFEILGEETKSIHELSATLMTVPDELARLLNAGVLLNLLEFDGHAGFRLSPMSRSVLLRSAGTAYIGDWLHYLDSLHPALFRLDEAARGKRPTIDLWSGVIENKEKAREFALAMHNYASFRGKELVNFLDLNSCSSLLDLGCGPGTYAFTLGMENPGLKLFLLDVPEVLEIAEEVQKEYKLKNEIHYIPSDVSTDEIPGSYDVVLVSNMLHMMGPEPSRKLIGRLYNAVKPGGSLVIQAQYLRDDRLGERWPVLLDLIMLSATRDGRNHSIAETVTWLEEAGFEKTEVCSMTIYNTNSFIRAYKQLMSAKQQIMQ
jgi:8-O-methyltransferase